MTTLAAQLALLADNATGDISAADMRAIVTDIWNRTSSAAPIEALAFDITPDAAAHTPGRLHWNAENGSLDLDTITAGASLSLGYEQWLRGRNTTGSTILDGTPVRISGGSGNNPVVSLDDGQGHIIGVATENIANNSDGRVTTFGALHGLNTSAFTDGARLYSTSAGALTTSQTPSFVGVVLNAHVTDGVLFVHPASFDHPDGTTAARPTTRSLGYMYFDTTLGKPIWWNGAAWVDATGATV